MYFIKRSQNLRRENRKFKRNNLISKKKEKNTDSNKEKEEFDMKDPKETM
jgi:hypothetical protein